MRRLVRVLAPLSLALAAACDFAGGRAAAPPPPPPAAPSPGTYVGAVMTDAPKRVGILAKLDPKECVPLSARPAPPPHDTALTFADLREDVRGVRLMECPRRGTAKLRVDVFGNGEWNSIDSLVVHLRPGAPPQVLLASAENESPPRGRAYLKAPDLDGDGWRDLMLLSWAGATGNTGHQVWLYAPRAGRFQADSALSSLSNLRVAPGRCVRGSSVGGAAGWIYHVETRCLRNGRFVVVREEDQDYIREGDYKVRTIRKLRGDTFLTRVDTIRHPAD